MRRAASTSHRTKVEEMNRRFDYEEQYNEIVTLPASKLMRLGTNQKLN